MIGNLDDSGQVSGYEKKGATVIKGEGRISGPDTVEVDGETLQTGHIVIATGSAPTISPVEGLDDVPVWTNREATTIKEVPERATIIGGGPVGIETAQMMSRFGSRVTLVQHSERLINREEPKVGELILGVFEEEGMDVRVGRRAEKARTDGPATLPSCGEPAGTTGRRSEKETRHD
ncbi:MAG: FAD-dependent oxidoreductase [Rubrobacter sp.]|nr:FAD-dependent oxidoreductase [Rubrobacter sp.]